MRASVTEVLTIKHNNFSKNIEFVALKAPIQGLTRGAGSAKIMSNDENHLKLITNSSKIQRKRKSIWDSK